MNSLSPSLLDADCLDAFVVFAECLNITHTAERMHLTQPAVHAQIRRLAESVGQPLYRRIGRRLELTAAGQRVASFGLEQRSRTAELFDVLRSGRSRQPVVLSAGAGAYLYLLGRGIQTFLERAEVPLRLLTHDASGAIDAVQSGVAHLGVAALDEPPPGLVSELLADVPPVVAVPTGHRLARKRTVAVSDLRGERLVVPPPGRPHRSAIATAMRDAGVEWEPAVEAGGWALMLRFVQIGMGIAIVNGCCTLPTGVTARPLRGFARTAYYVFTRDGANVPKTVVALRTSLLSSRDDWRAATRVAYRPS